MGVDSVNLGPIGAPAGPVRLPRIDSLSASAREQRHPIAADASGAALRRAAGIAAELRRAINRQVGELGALRSAERRALPVERPAAPEPAPAPAPVTYHRKSYAPDAIGVVAAPAHAAAPAPAPAPVASVPMVSNLGTLIDVLA